MPTHPSNVLESTQNAAGWALHGLYVCTNAVCTNELNVRISQNKAREVLLSDLRFESAAGRVRCFTSEGVLLDDGDEIPADVVLFCTGFKAVHGMVDPQVRGVTSHCTSLYFTLTFVYCFCTRMPCR